DCLRAVPPAQARWLESLPLWHLNPRGLFVHAGVCPGIDLQAQTEQDLLWIRRPFLDDCNATHRGCFVGACVLTRKHLKLRENP
ncbi:hypothetical protein P8631_17935, partial [Guyparkeria sp. 1SP6A2]|nr:hypothetical protein [Guyparkeria sp. 1SP6A2]